MASLTVQTILDEGGLLAGDTALNARALVDLNAWLRSQYDGFLWPFLRRELSGIALGAGIQKLTMGAGSGGIATEVQRFNDPLHIYTSGYFTRSDIRIVSDWGDASKMPNNVVNNPATNRGLPSQVRLRHSATAPGQWDLIFDMVADRAYLLEVSYYARPAAITLTDIPLYPNDRTLIQAVSVFVLRYKKSEEASGEWEALVAMVNEDRLKYGSLPGINDMLFLDPKVYR